MFKQIRRCLVALLVLAIGSQALANKNELMRAEIFAMDSKKQNLIYRLKSEIRYDGAKRTSTAVYEDAKGDVLIREKSESENGELKKYEIEQLQTKNRAIIEVKDGKVVFKKANSLDEKAEFKEEEEKLKKPLVLSPLLVPFVQSRFEEIKKGDTVDIRFAVWDRMETVGFSLFKIGETLQDGRKMLIVKMKPTSFVIAAIVDPLIFHFDMETKHLAYQKGRVAPKLAKGSSWKDVDAESYYVMSDLQ